MSRKITVALTRSQVDMALEALAAHLATLEDETPNKRRLTVAHNTMDAIREALITRPRRHGGAR